MKLPSLLLILMGCHCCCQAFVLEGSQTSYAQFRKWYSSPNASLEFEFLTSNANGLLLYTDDGGYYDFLEVKLVEGSLRIRLNLGNGAQIADLGQDLHKILTWHKVKIKRNLTQTLIELDSKFTAILPDSSKFRPVHTKPGKVTSISVQKSRLEPFFSLQQWNLVATSAPILLCMSVDCRPFIPQSYQA